MMYVAFFWALSCNEELFECKDYVNYRRDEQNRRDETVHVKTPLGICNRHFVGHILQRLCNYQYYYLLLITYYLLVGQSSLKIRDASKRLHQQLLQDGGQQVDDAGSGRQKVDGSKPASQKSRVLFAHDDGSIVEALFLNQGSITTQVVRNGSSGTKLLGNIRLMVDNKTGQQSLQAQCKVHNSNCKCWISNTNHFDLLLDWLGNADQHVKDKHQELATDLKVSIGMKVRSRK